MQRIFLLLALVCATSGTYNFVVVGDWGGQTRTPFTTETQLAVAAGMGKVAADINAHFVIALGDNFYSYGIDTDVTDPRFRVTFENVYTDASLQIPWYVVLGNHDYQGNVTAQVDYTTVSSRWKMPTTYFDIVERYIDDEGVAATLHMIFIDTVALAGNTLDLADEFDQPRGPLNATAAEEQWDWIESKLAGSTADYLWVAGHYPVWSGCQHGPTTLLVDRLKPMLEKYRATGYFSGHDHCLEYIDDGTEPKYVLSGNGKMCCYAASKVTSCPADSIKFIVAGTQSSFIGGFNSVYLGTRSMDVLYHDQDGAILYQATIAKRT
eukprot:m.243654 g.243654  ORF g.243654 m.243654 type:complete len:323 (+) comp14281_c0_seq1:457-1425(+)